jgi:hypothetical protein
MTMRVDLQHRLARATVVLAATAGVCSLAAPPAAALNPLKPVCKVAQLGSGAVSKLCGVAAAPGKLLGAGKKLITGHIGGALNEIFGGGGGSGGGSAVSTAAGLAAVGVWVLGGAHFALNETAKVLSRTTTPQLRTTWFSSAYWRMAAIAALLTLPFLFAAAIQAMVRGDLSLLARASFGYLPLALVSVGIAAPLTMLVLVATDQLCAVVTAAAGHESTHFLTRAGAVVGVLSVFRGSPFLAFLVGLIAAAGALVLWLELLMREAAVYIVVLMLPLVFAAMVWPARRIWAIRVVELLVALILAKFAIVAVLALGGAALGRGGGGVAGALGGAVLVLLGAFAPWALMRLLPLAELAGGAAGALRQQTRFPVAMSAEEPGALVGPAAGWARALTAGMSQEAAALHVDPREDLGLRSAGPRFATAAGGARAGERPAEDSAELVLAGVAEGGGQAITGEGASAGPAEGPRPPQAGTAGPAPWPRASGGGADPSAADGGPSPASPAERSPGLGAMWQQPDLSWRPLELGGDCPPPPDRWAPEGTGPEGAGGPSAPGHRPPSEPGEAPIDGGEDEGPLPDPQPSDDDTA